MTSAPFVNTYLYRLYFTSECPNPETGRFDTRVGQRAFLGRTGFGEWVTDSIEGWGK